MSELTSHGTGWSETELLLDVINAYNNWDQVDAPAFGDAQRRLREKFTTHELIVFHDIITALQHLTEFERMRRIKEQQESAPAQP